MTTYRPKTKSGIHEERRPNSTSDLCIMVWSVTRDPTQSLYTRNDHMSYRIYEGEDVDTLIGQESCSLWTVHYDLSEQLVSVFERYSTCVTGPDPFSYRKTTQVDPGGLASYLSVRSAIMGW